MIELRPLPADLRLVLPFVLIVVGFVVGIALGRWWALLAALAIGVWGGTSAEVEVPGWLIGAYLGLPAGLGIATGVTTRNVLARRRRAARV